MIEATEVAGRRARWFVVAVGLLLVLLVLTAVGCTRGPSTRQVTVAAVGETAPVPSGDSADDPAVWVHPRDPARSLVLGTNKDGGLGVYDLGGRQVRYLAGGELNNVDVRGNLVVATDRSDDTLKIWRVNPATGELAEAPGRRLAPMAKIYGLCLWSAPDGGVHAFVGDEDGRFQQWRLRQRADGQVDAKLLRTLAVGTKSEGCVVDDRRGLLYVGEETGGIWRYRADPARGDRRTRVDTTGRGGHLTADVEGLALYVGSDGTSWLIASSQGSDSYVVYDHSDGDRYVETFRVTDGGVDGTSETDGLAATSTPLGSRFPQGLLVVHDDANDDGRQNFKLVDWRDVERRL